MPRFRTMVSASLMLLFATPLAAQGPRVTLNAFGGVYLPTADLFDEVFVDGQVTIGQKTGFNVGGRAAIWLADRIGVEAEGMLVSSDVEVSGVAAGGGGVVPISGESSANAFYGSLNVAYAVFQPPLEPVAIFISGGVGIISRSGDGFENLEDTSDIAGVVGIGARYGIARGIWIRADVKDYISQFEEGTLSESVGSDTGQLQNDLLISAGLELTFGGV